MDNTIQKYKKKISSLENPSTSSDWEMFNKLQPLAALLDQLDDVEKKIAQAEEILNADESSDMHVLAEQDLADLIVQKDALAKNIRRAITELESPTQTRDEDVKSLIIEIRAGAGGEEAALFASDLFRMYSLFSQKNDFDLEIMSKNISDTGGFKEITAKIAGDLAYQQLKYESGVHRVQRIPTTESSGRIHTSTASVAIMPEAKAVDIEIKPDEITVETFRASGAGGQHVNKTDSAIRITHKPTGIVVSCQESRSQIKNRDAAMSLLRTKLLSYKIEEQQSKRDSLRKEQIGSAMRSEKIRTYNYPQSRITDHRIKKSWHNLDKILDGNIEEIVKDIEEFYTKGDSQNVDS